MPHRATTLWFASQTGCDGDVAEDTDEDMDEQEEPETEVGASILEVVGPELARCSALADRLAGLLLPPRLFS